MTREETYEAVWGVRSGVPGGYPDSDMRAGLSIDGDVRGLCGVEVPNVGARNATGLDRQQGPRPDDDPTPADNARPKVSRLLVPFGRPHLRALADAPELVKLYFLLADGCDKSRYSVRDSEYDIGVYVRGYQFDRLEDYTYVFDVGELGEVLCLDHHATTEKLLELFDRACLEMVVIVPERFWSEHEYYCSDELPPGTIRRGSALSEYAEGGYLYSGEGAWKPSFARVERQDTHKGGFVQVPQEARDLPDRQLHFLVHVYSRAVFHPTRRIYNGRVYQLQPGEFVASYREIGRELGVHQQQVIRWAEAVLKLQLLRKIPAKDDALWRIVGSSSKPKGGAE